MDILKMVSDKDRLEFSQNLSITRNYMGDTLFPDVKTENLMAEYYRLSDSLKLPTMASVHAFDTEANIGKRPTAEKVTIEKLFIKEKINQSERVRLLKNTGVSEQSLINYIYDDMGRLAESVKTRTEVAKMELLSTGKMIVKENNLNFEIDYAVKNRKSYDWSDPDHDIMNDIQEMWEMFKTTGNTANRVVTSTKIMNYLRKNTAIQKMINSTNGVGMFITNGQINALMSEVFGLTLTTNDEQYKFTKPDGTDTTKRYFPENGFTMLETINNALGTGLWGVTPEEEELGQYTEKSANQYITITQWATQDPVAVWTKASGVFVPVLTDPNSIVIGKIKLS